MAEYITFDDVRKLRDMIEEQYVNLCRMRKALEYYANEDIYILRRDMSGYATLSVESDKGNIARRALKEAS